MHIRHLRIFLAVCEQGGVTRAAEGLYLSQPAVSRAIAELERQLGFPLFDRISHRLRLTGPGVLFRERAARLVECYDELERSARGCGEAAPLRVGSSITLAGGLLPAALCRYAAEGAGPPVLVRVDNASAVIMLLDAGELDLALVEGVVGEGDYVRYPLPPSSLAVVCAPSHPLAGGGEVGVGALLAQALLLREKGSAIRDTFDSALLLLGASARPAWESVNSQALLRAAMAGLGVAVLPAATVGEAVRAGRVVALRVLGLALSCQNQLLLHRQKYQPPSLGRLIALLRAEAGEIGGGT